MERVNICISQHLADALMLHSGFTDSLGLLNDKMGEAITFYRLSPNKKDHLYRFCRRTDRCSLLPLSNLRKRGSNRLFKSVRSSRKKPDDQVVLPVDFNPAEQLRIRNMQLFEVYR
ncbi:MAG: hypothetical protein AB2L20_22395 [Mangrovibacterium sp.]